MGMFHPLELEGLICGSRILDFTGLQREARYDGYEEDDEIIE
jgi:hypothetical protein